MNLELRKRREEPLARKKKSPADLDALSARKRVTVSWKPDNAWHDLVLVTEEEEMRLSIDGKAVARHRSECFAHPVKRWFSFLVPGTVWVDDVKIWRVKWRSHHAAGDSGVVKGAGEIRVRAECAGMHWRK